MKIPYLLSAIPVFLAALDSAVAVPALTVDYANLDYDDLATDTVNCSAKLTWIAGTAVDIQRRKGNEATWTTIATGDDSGEYIDNDPAVIPSVTYHYRLSADGATGTEVDFLAVRHLPTAGYPLFSDGDYTSQSWCKPYNRAFDGNTSQDSYPDAASPQRPKIGVDFGAATNYLAFARLVPRYTDGCENRLHHTVIYGTADSETDGTALTDESEVAGVNSGSGKQWYKVTANNSSTAYRCYYFKGAEGANITECAFFGWTAADAINADAIDLVCSVTRVDWESSNALVEWDASVGTVTVQRKTGYNGAWVDLGESNNGSFTDIVAPFGQTILYRVMTSNGPSLAATFFRMRRLHTAGYLLFMNGEVPGGWGKPLSNAFDENPETYPDLSFSEPARFGVDFGQATNYVAFVRLWSRTDGCAYRIRGSVLRGSGANWENEGVGLTPAVQQVNGVYSYEFDVDPSIPYRCYYIYNTDMEDQAYGCGNVAEIELYGWSADDVGQALDPFGLTVTRSDLENYLPVFSWNAGTPTATMQRRVGDGAWSSLATIPAGISTWTDTQAKVGFPYEYRLVAGSVIGGTVSFRRLRRLDTAGYTLFSQGTPYSGSDPQHALVFDGDTTTFADISYSSTYPKIGVDFGDATNIVAMARLYPRTSIKSRMVGTRLFGSENDAVTEREAAEQATALTEAIDAVPDNKWYEVPVVADEPAPYRTYYVQGMQYGNIADVELYGWWLSDLIDYTTVILVR